MTHKKSFGGAKRGGVIQKNLRRAKLIRPVVKNRRKILKTLKSIAAVIEKRL